MRGNQLRIDGQGETLVQEGGPLASGFMSACCGLLDPLGQSVAAHHLHVRACAPLLTLHAPMGTLAAIEQ